MYLTFYTKSSSIFKIQNSVCLVVFAVQYQHLMARKIQNQETYYRDFLFRVLSENIDTVFMIYNLDLHCMEFVSTNTRRMLGLDHQALETGCKFDTLSSRIKVLERRMGEVAQLKTHIINYSETATLPPERKYTIQADYSVCGA